MTDAKQIAAKLKLYMGEEARDIYSAMKHANKDKDGAAEIKKALKNYFAPKHSVYEEIGVFRNAKRCEGESINEFVTRLRVLAKYCDFADTMEKEIERKLVVGCNMEEVQNKCAQGRRYCDWLHSSMAKIRAAGESTSTSSRNTIAYTGFKSATGCNGEKCSSQFEREKRTCFYWGGKPHDDKHKCPAMNQQCHNCKRMNHFARFAETVRAVQMVQAQIKILEALVINGLNRSRVLKMGSAKIGIGLNVEREKIIPF